MCNYRKYISKFQLGKIHQVIENHAHTFDLKNNYLGEDYPWEGILASTAFNVQIMYHAMLQAMPGQLVFVCDMILLTLWLLTGKLLGGVSRN